MFLWILSFLSFLSALQCLTSDLSGLGTGAFGFQKKKREIERGIHLFRELEDSLASGMVPRAERWEALNTLPPPWSGLAVESLLELRSSGGALLPTLVRLRSLAEEQVTSLGEARAKTSQSLAQALACAALVPVLGVTLYLILPEVSKNSYSWWIACGLAWIWTGLGANWLFRMAEAARWGGLSIHHRSWVLSSQCAGERFLALVRAGTPADLAWNRACEFLVTHSADLSLGWGHSVWESSERNVSGMAENTILNLGLSVRKAIQVSLMEGRACTERVEGLLKAARVEMKSHIDRELALLSTRALKPLFIFVAPALVSLLVFGIYLSASEVLGDLGAF